MMTIAELIVQTCGGVFITMTVIWLIHTVYAFFSLEKDE